MKSCIWFIKGNIKTRKVSSGFKKLAKVPNTFKFHILSNLCLSYVSLRFVHFSGILYVNRTYWEFC